MNSSFILATFSCLLCYCGLVNGHLKLNVPRIRLPFFENQNVNFTLRADTPGCYLWKVSRSDLVDLQLIGDIEETKDRLPCSNMAAVKSYPGRLHPAVLPINAIVFASDPHTGEQVRCDVIIDKVSSIQIVTTTKELHLEEAPSKFHVRAYDVKMNEFSSLEGVPIVWQLRRATKTDGVSICKFIPFSQSPYKAPVGIANLESIGKRGSTVLVEGVKTGSSFMVASLEDSYYHDVWSEVRIFVVANLHVEPAVAFVLPGTVVPLRLWQAKRGKFMEIKLPSDVYEVQIGNKSVVSYDPETSFLTALDYGDAHIVVKDKNWENEVGDEHPKTLTCDIYVRLPNGLLLEIFPHRNWAVALGEKYEIQIDILFDHNKMVIPEETYVETVFDPTYFRVDHSCTNGTWHHGIPSKLGRTDVRAELISWASKKGFFSSPKLFKPQKPVRGDEEMIILQNVAITPKLTVLPWDPYIQPKYELQWKASGGGSGLEWKSSNTSVMTVTQGERGRTEGYGSAIVTASASLNPSISDSSEVHVVNPLSMSIIEGVFEAQIGSYIHIPLAFYTKIIAKGKNIKGSTSDVPYSSCLQLPIKVQISNQEMFVYEERTKVPHMKPACRTLPIRTKGLGSATVSVAYKTADGKTLQDSVIISTFAPLKVLEPVKEEIVMAVGSTKQIVLQGGPRPMVDSHDRFFRVAKVSDGQIARYKELKTPDDSPIDVYAYEILCKEIGESDFVFSVGNNQSSADGDSLPSYRSVMEVAVVKTICAEPFDVYFKIEVDKISSKCPSYDNSASVNRIAVPNYERTDISVVIKDKNGKRFDNVTSLQILWYTSPSNFAQFKTENYVVTEGIKTVFGFTSSGKNFQSFHGLGPSGAAEITAEIIGYRSDVLKSYDLPDRKIPLHSPTNSDLLQEPSLTYSMDVLFVGDVVLSPSPLNLFNHPSSKGTIKVKHGSGHFEVSVLGTSKIKANYFSRNRTIEVSPLEEGSGKVIVKDVCLSKAKAAEALVEINGVGSIQVDVQDKLQLGDESTIHVSIFDHKGALLEPKMLTLVNLRLDQPQDNSLVEITPMGLGDSYVKYNVKGMEVGLVTLSYSADATAAGIGVPGKLIRSLPKRITIYPPLKLEPRDLVILLGAEYQVFSYGGPPSDSVVEFTSGNLDRAEVQNNGLVVAKSLGKTKVYGRCVDATKRSTIFSEDYVNVNVVTLESIRIHSPLLKIKRNEQMPIWVVGTGPNGERIQPDVMLEADPAQSFKWSLSNRDVAKIESTFWRYGLKIPTEDNMRVAFHAMHSGRVTISVEVVFGGRLYSDDLQIQILDDLELLDASIPNLKSVLMSPNSALNLKTKGGSRVSYYITPAIHSTVERLVSIDNLNQLKSSDQLGIDSVLVQSETDRGLHETLSVLVEVKRVRYIMLTPELPVSFKKHLPGGIPNGLTFKVTVSFHDDLGRKFHSTNHAPKVRPNRMDIVHVENTLVNNSFATNTLTTGRTAFYVHDGNGNGNEQQVTDFLVFPVTEIIKPSIRNNILKVGDIVCFQCGLKSLETTLELERGSWFSDSPDVFSIDKASGNGIAISPGYARVRYSAPGVQFTSSVTLEIRPIHQLSWKDPNKQMHVSNAVFDSFVDFPLTLDGRSDVSFGSNCSGSPDRNYPIVCTARFENKDYEIMPALKLFHIRPVFDFDQRTYVCRLDASGYEVDDLLIASVIESQVIISAHMEDGKIFTPPLVLEFYPAVFIHSTDLVISSNELTTSLTVTGLKYLLDQLKIAKLSDHLIIRENERMSSFEYLKEKIHGVKNEGSAQTRHFLVSVDKSYWNSGIFHKENNLGFIVNSPLTKQSVNINVAIKSVPCGFYGISGHSETFSFSRLFLEFMPTVAGVVVFTILLGFAIHAVYSIFFRSEISTTENAVFVSPGGKSNSKMSFTSDPNHSTSYQFNTSFSNGDPPTRKLFSSPDSSPFGYNNPYKRNSP